VSGRPKEPARGADRHGRVNVLLIEGIVLLVLGVLAVVIPPLATLTFTVLLGCLFLIRGVVGFSRHSARGA
jgi:uncharacterized membrane protein HdeD (DUF308 family)